MAQKTLIQLMSSMAPHINGDVDVPTTGDDEYLLWQEALNQAQDDWQDMDYDWPQLRKISTVTVLMSGTSVALPSDFRKLRGNPDISGVLFPEVNPEEVYRFLSTDSFVTVDFNQNCLNINPPQPTTAAMRIPYLGRATSLATTTAVSPCPSDNFLVYRAASKILLSRDDGKYVEFESKSDDLKQVMIGSSVHDDIQKDTRIKSKQELMGFTIGVS